MVAHAVARVAARDLAHGGHRVRARRPPGHRARRPRRPRPRGCRGSRGRGARARTRIPRPRRGAPAGVDAIVGVGRASAQAEHDHDGAVGSDARVRSAPHAGHAAASLCHSAPPATHVTSRAAPAAHTTSGSSTLATTCTPGWAAERVAPAHREHARLGVPVELVAAEVQERHDRVRRGVERGGEVRLVDFEHDRPGRRSSSSVLTQPFGRFAPSRLVVTSAPSVAATIAVVVVLPFVPETRHTVRPASSVGEQVGRDLAARRSRGTRSRGRRERGPRARRPVAASRAVRTRTAADRCSGAAAVLGRSGVTGRDANGRRPGERSVGCGPAEVLGVPLVHELGDAVGEPLLDPCRTLGRDAAVRDRLVELRVRGGHEGVDHVLRRHVVRGRDLGDGLARCAAPCGASCGRCRSSW